jgi:hypothetical protein
VLSSYSVALDEVRMLDSVRFSLLLRTADFEAVFGLV